MKDWHGAIDTVVAILLGPMMSQHMSVLRTVLTETVTHALVLTSKVVPAIGWHGTNKRCGSYQS